MIPNSTLVKIIKKHSFRFQRSLRLSFSRPEAGKWNPERPAALKTFFRFNHIRKIPERVQQNIQNNKKLDSNILRGQARDRVQNINDTPPGGGGGGGEIKVIDAFTTHLPSKLDRLLESISNKQIIYARIVKKSSRPWHIYAMRLRGKLHCFHSSFRL